MDQGKKLVFGIGMQLLLLAITLFFVFAIVWTASKAWSVGQERKAA